jgi:membrane protease YdiL (CAAX protease family)
MIRISPDLVVFSILFSLLMVALMGMLWAWAGALRRIWRGQPLVGDYRAMPLKPALWGSFTVLSLVFLYLGVNLSVARFYAAATGRHLPRVAKQADNQEGAGGPVKAIEESKNDQKRIEPAEVAPPGQNKDLKARSQDPGPDSSPEQSQAELMFQLAVSNGLLLVLVPAFVRVTSGASLAELGLDFKEWPRQVGIGVRAAMLMTPAVYAIQFVAVRIWPPRMHPVELMVLEKLTVGAAILAVLSAMVLAPMIEELLFRGIVQRWLSRLVDDRPERTITTQETGPPGRFKPEGEPLSGNSMGTPFVPTVIHLGGEKSASRCQLAEPTSPRSSYLPILLTSLFFAAMHLPQWPAPIAIFPLSMALGIVYQRSSSLLAAITMHATFNGISTLLLLLAALGRHIQPPIGPATMASLAPGFLTDLLSSMGFG